MTAIAGRVTGSEEDWAARMMWFRRQLVEFDRQLVSLDRHADQFELQLTFMYRQFVREGPAVLGPRTTGPGLPGTDNLDSGNAALPPPSGLVQGLRDCLNRPADLRVYAGPEAEASLAGAVAAYWNHVLRPSRPATPNQVTVGAGTVNLWDGLIRQYLRPADGVVVATPTYGFFLPHVSRAGGVPIAIPTRGGLLDPEQLVGAVLDFDATGRRDWRRRGGPDRLRHKLEERLTPAEAATLVAEFEAAVEQGCDPEAITRRLISVISEFDLDLDLDPDWMAREANSHAPPRASMLLHLNPTLNGAIYGRKLTRALMATATRLELRVVEDLSYFPVRTADADIVSVREFVPRSISLLGVSKVLGIADLRVGMAVADQQDGLALMRRVENSVGFVPRFVQRGLARQLADLAGVDQFIAESDAVYEARLELLIHCLGASDAGAAPHTSARVQTSTLRSAARLVGDRAEVDALVKRFLTGRLADYLGLDSYPAAGFFALLDCSAAIDVLRSAGVGEIQDSFGLAAFLAHFAGVRTISSAVADTNVGAAPPLLRVSFSVNEDTLVTSLFYVYVLIDCTAAGGASTR